MERACEALPFRSGVVRLHHRALQVFAELLVRELPSREADDRGPGMQELLLREAEERGDELPMGEIAGRAEDDEGAGGGGAERDALLAERIELGRGRSAAAGTHVVFTAWPPNLCRSAAST